jgi:NADH:ubiquinone oxidoreductase subunit E
MFEAKIEARTETRPKLEKMTVKKRSQTNAAECMAKLELKMKSLGYAEQSLIPVLIAAQEIYRFLPENIMIHIAKKLHIPTSRVWAVATFYDMFKFELDEDSNIRI